MIALDTNVLVRYLTRDDPEQTRTARRVMQSERLWVGKTVLLETEWVLRFTYSTPREQVLNAFRTLLGIRSVEAEDRAEVLEALEWHAQGLDFADALHLASRGMASRFATFDRPLARAAERIPECGQVELL